MGPDSSLLIAEIILSAVDDRLKKYSERAIRYMDDYEFIADTEGEALRILADLQHELLKFELHLNPAKTGVRPLPASLEELWTGPLRAEPLDPTAIGFKAQVLRFFDTAFDLSVRFPSAAVLKYAVGRIANLPSVPESALIEDLLLQSARVSPGSLALVLRIILNNPTLFNRKKKRASLLINTILQHAPQRHSSEVAWSIWGCIALNIPLTSEAIAAVVEMEDSVCALLLLHAQTLGLASARRATKSFEAVMVPDELYDRRWLLSYEANIKGWVNSPRGDHVTADANFNRLKQAGVSFYDTKALSFMPRGSKRRVLPGATEAEAAGDTLAEQALAFDIYE